MYVIIKRARWVNSDYSMKQAELSESINLPSYEENQTFFLFPQTLCYFVFYISIWEETSNTIPPMT